MKLIIRPRFNYGDENPLDIPEEEFLSARPPALTPEQLAAMEIEPPNWALAATCKVGGKRQPKRLYLASQIIPWESLDNNNSFSPAGPKLPLMFGKRASQDAEEAYNRALDRRRRKQGSRNTPAARKQVPPGNLRNDDYRFWKGYVTPDSGAQCKWCSSYYHTRPEMLEHHVKGQCKEHLLALYRYVKLSSKQRYCFACRKQTANAMWGVPLCNQPTCIGRWKFTVHTYLTGYMQYLEWAREAQREDPSTGPFAHIGPSGKGLGA